MADEKTPREGLQDGAEVEGVQMGEEQIVDVDELLLGNREGFGVVVDKPKAPKAKPTKPEASDGEPDDAKDNNEVRAKYFQSQYDREKNKAKALEERLAMIESRLATPSQPAPVAPVAPAPQEEAAPPPAPEMPKKPDFFNPAEVGDPSTESYRYAVAIDDWRNKMVIHNQKLVEFNSNRSARQVAELLEKQEKEKEAERIRAQQKEQLLALQSELTSKYGATPEQAINFIQEMSKPDSVSLDNLWQLFALEHQLDVRRDKPIEMPVDDTSGMDGVPLKPSPEFEQVRKAQQIPNAMGVVPGSGQKGPQMSEEDILWERMKRIQDDEQIVI